jgi:hypothetical protein
MSSTQVQAGLGLLRKVLPDLSNTTVEELEGINVVRRMLGRTWIDPVRCERGIEALRGYRREHDERLKVRSMSLPSNLSP